MATKVTGRGDNFVLLRLKLARVSRRRPIDRGPAPSVPHSLPDATEAQFFSRQYSEMMVMVYAAVTLEARRFPRTPIFTSAPAEVQRIKSGDLIGPLPKWLVDSKGEKLLEWTHRARCQISVGGVLLQHAAPTVAQTDVEREFSEVIGVSSAHNQIDTNTDRVLVPKHLGILNGIAVTESPLTVERLIAGLQYMNRAEAEALARERSRIEKALLAKKGDQEALLMQLDIVKVRQKLNDDFPLPSGLTGGLLSDIRDRFQVTSPDKL